MNLDPTTAGLAQSAGLPPHPSNPAQALLPDFMAMQSRWVAQPKSFVLETFRQSPHSARHVAIDDQQARILEAVARSDKVAVRSSRGVGKTAGAAMLTHWWLATRYPATVILTAGSWAHLEDKLMPEVHIWGRNWVLADAFEYQAMGIYSNDNPHGLRAVSVSSDRAVNVEGFHSPHLLIIVDEAKGMADEIFDGLIASLTGLANEGEQKICALSTPPLTKQGWFARVSSGTEWDVVHISGLDSPRVSSAYTQEILDSYGEDSPQYQSYVLGITPDSSSETVIPSMFFEACQELEPCDPKRNTRRPIITLDVAREGDDLSVFGVFDCAAFDLVKFDADGHPGWFSHVSLMELCGRALQAVRLYPNARAICIDDTGLGGGVTDRLRELQYEGKFPSRCSIVAVKFGSTPGREDRFKQKKDELWWAGRDALRERKLALPTDAEIRAWRCPRGSDFKIQMTSALYEYDSSDRIDVLDRRVKGRDKTLSLPTKSPDIAHAFILGVRYYLRQSTIEVPEDEERTPAAALGKMLQAAVKSEIKRGRRPTNPFERRR